MSVGPAPLPDTDHDRPAALLDFDITQKGKQA
jgi:hypothetical protein